MEHKRATFLAIKDFVTALNPYADSNKVSPFNVYLKLIQGTDATEKTVVIRTLKGFESFFKKNKSFRTQLPAGAKITYKTQEELVYIPIGKIYSSLPPANQQIIQQHLTAIHACLYPTEQNLEELSKVPETSSESIFDGGIESILNDVDSSTPEGQFIQKTVKGMQEVITTVNLPNMEGGSFDMAGMAAVGMSLFGNPAFAGIFSELNAGLTSGDFKLERFMTSLGPKAAQIGATLQGVMPALSQMNLPVVKPAEEQ